MRTFYNIKCHGVIRRQIVRRALLSLRFSARDVVEGDDQFGGRVGSQEIAVALIEPLYLRVVEPIALAAADESKSLGIHSLVWDVGSPRVVDMLDDKRQPTAVTRHVGEERRVVARSA